MTLGTILLIGAILAFAVTASAAMALQFREDPPAGTIPALAIGAFVGISSLALYIGQA